MEKPLHHCTFTQDDGTWCGNKSYQIIVDFDRKEVFCVCKKHKFTKFKESMQIINIKTFIKNQEITNENKNI